MKVRLTAAQLHSLRYAGRGELTGTLATDVYCSGSGAPRTRSVAKLVQLGLVMESRPPGCHTRIVLTAKGALVLAQDARADDA